MGLSKNLQQHVQTFLKEYPQVNQSWLKDLLDRAQTESHDALLQKFENLVKANFRPLYFFCEYEDCDQCPENDSIFCSMHKEVIGD